MNEISKYFPKSTNVFRSSDHDPVWVDIDVDSLTKAKALQLAGPSTPDTNPMLAAMEIQPEFTAAMDDAMEDSDYLPSDDGSEYSGMISLTDSDLSQDSYEDESMSIDDKAA